MKEPAATLATLAVGLCIALIICALSPADDCYYGLVKQISTKFDAAVNKKSPHL